MCQAVSNDQKQFHQQNASDCDKSHHSNNEETKFVLKRSLSKELKSGTAESHKAAENVHFVKNFIQKKIRRDLYQKLIINYYFVYQNLEEELNKHGPQHFSKLHLPNQLARTSSLEKDVNYFMGYDKEWKSIMKPTAAVQNYIHRIRHVAQIDPLLLLAHSYTRYLGDLSGGRQMASIAKKTLKLHREGLDFYNFDKIASPKEFKESFRKELDSLALSSEQIQSLVHEANIAFLLNVRIFEELDVISGEVEGASVTPLEDAYQIALTNSKQYDSKEHDSKEHSSKKPKKVCPFMVSKNSSKESKKVCPFMVSKNRSKRCPWPFIFFHDPMQGMLDVQTWLFIGVLSLPLLYYQTV